MVQPTVTLNIFAPTQRRAFSPFPYRFFLRFFFICLSLIVFNFQVSYFSFSLNLVCSSQIVSSNFPGFGSAKHMLLTPYCSAEVVLLTKERQNRYCFLLGKASPNFYCFRYIGPLTVSQMLSGLLIEM